MSYASLVQILKGSGSSGNWGHAGRPGKHGGSARGGGHGAIGIAADADRFDKLESTDIYRDERTPRKDYSGQKGFPYTNPKIVSDHYSTICSDMEDECGSMKYYSSDGYVAINNHLRASASLEGATVIEEIDKMFKNGPTVPVNMTVTRGVSKDVFDMISPGSTFQDKAYVSTTINSKTRFGDYRIKIRVPKGSKGLYLESLSSYPNENELLLDRNQKFQVISKKGRDVVVELIN